MFGLRKRPKTPVERLKKAVDELDAALTELNLDMENRHLRVFITSYDPRTRQRSRPLIGYWANGDFNPTYDPRD